MLALNLLPVSRRLKECIRRGWCAHAWRATPNPWLKPFTAIAAFLYITFSTLGSWIWFVITNPTIFLWIPAIVIGVPLAIVLALTVGPGWLIREIYRYYTGWDTQYAIVIDCSVTEHLALYKTLFDQFPGDDRYSRYDLLAFPDNHLCYGPRRSVQLAARRLREIGVPCRVKRVRGGAIDRKACGFRIRLDDYRDSASGFLELMPFCAESQPRLGGYTNISLL